MASPPQFPLLNDVPLVPEVPPRPSFTRRIQRAHDLSESFAAGREVLDFYAQLAFHQEHVFASLNQKREPDLLNDSWPLMLDVVLPLFPQFARSIAGVAPMNFRERALALADLAPSEQGEALTRFWDNGFEAQTGDTAADRIIAMAFLQPYAEWLAQSGHRTAAPTHHATCPVCGSEPICAVLRDRGQGAGRSLVCSLCMNEWTFLRVGCPACGEERFDSLPVFTPEAIPHVRIDACDNCHHYFKTIDMTKDGLAVPVVDELVAVSLDLWTTEKGYRKLTQNLAGL